MTDKEVIKLIEEIVRLRAKIQTLLDIIERLKSK